MPEARVAPTPRADTTASESTNGAAPAAGTARKDGKQQQADSPEREESVSKCDDVKGSPPETPATGIDDPGGKEQEGGASKEAPVTTARSTEAVPVAAEPATEMDTDVSAPSNTHRPFKKRQREDESDVRASGEEEASDETDAGGNKARESRWGSSAGLDTPKPLEDPKVCEVVSQDLATQEIKRVRRKDSDPGAPPPPAARQEAAVDGVLPNGVAPAEQRPHANGRREQREANEPGEESGLGQLGSGNAAGSVSEPLGAGSEGTTVEGQAAAAAANAASNAAGESPEKGEGTNVEGESQQPNGVLPRSSKSAAFMLPPLPKSSVAKGAFSSSSAGAGDTPSFSGGKGAAQARSERTRVEPAEGEQAKKPWAAENQKDEKGVDKEGRGKEGVAARAGTEVEENRRSLCPDHALPVARTFFDYESVSGLEMRMLPEFFTGRSASKTPEMYMKSRNYMVQSYQRMLEADADGQAFLTGTECRRKLAGDACSILRIHDFLDRFGLINTRTAGKRPAFYPAAPPSMHLWNPTPPLAGPPPADRPSSGDINAAAASTATSERGFSLGGPGEPGAVGSSALGGGGVGGGWSSAGERRAQLGLSSGSGDEREWHREELIILMKAAVANPHQWDAVANQVAGGRTPAACMKKFLNLAVEEVVGGETPPTPVSAPRPPTSTGSSGGEAAPEAGSKAREGGGNSNKAGTPDQGGLFAREHQQQNQQRKRPAHLGPAVPALVLASTLISNVHPEVLKAAMSAAVEAADAVARRSTAPVVATAANQGVRRVSLMGRSSSGSFWGGKGKGVASFRGEEDAEMEDVEDVAAVAARSVGSSVGKGEILRASVADATNGRRESGADIPRQIGSGGGADGASAVLQSTRDRVDGGSSAGAAGLELAGAAGLELADAARATVLSVAGLQARVLAEQEERRTEALLADLLEARVQRLEAKLHCFDELDKVLQTELESLEHGRAELLLQQARSMLER